MKKNEKKHYGRQTRSLPDQHLLERIDNVARNTVEWRDLRIRHGDEIREIGLLLFGFQNLLRHADEVLYLGKEQDWRLNKLLVRHANERMATVPFNK